MPRKPETPFHKIMVTRNKLRLYVEFGENALDGETPQEFAAVVGECLDHLIDFRNIVNGMVALEETPSRAALNYIPMDEIREAMEAA